MRFLLDTNIVSNLVRYPHGRVADRPDGVGLHSKGGARHRAAPSDPVHGGLGETVPYKTAKEHWEALKAKYHGGVKLTSQGDLPIGLASGVPMARPFPVGRRLDRLLDGQGRQGGSDRLDQPSEGRHPDAWRAALFQPGRDHRDLAQGRRQAHQP